MTNTRSAAASACPIASPCAMVREYRCGWKTATSRRPGYACRAADERRHELRGMVRVVVHDRDAAVLAEPLEPPAHAGERRQRVGGRLEGTTQRLHRAERAPRRSEGCGCRAPRAAAGCSRPSAPRDASPPCRRRPAPRREIRISASAAKPNRRGPLSRRAATRERARIVRARRAPRRARPANSTKASSSASTEP